MKAIQITMDEKLLSALDADEEVKRLGRSEVLRRAAAAYLRDRRAESIAARYEAGYGAPGRGGLGEDFAGWEDEGTWPDD